MDRHDEVMVEQEIELDAAAEDVWRAISEPGDQAAWLGDEVDLPVTPGGSGRIVDDGVVRRVRVDEVDEGRQLAFRWWDEDGGETGATRVVITLLPGDGGRTRLRVREVALQPSTLSATSATSATSARAWAGSLRWEVRLACLTLLLSAFALV